MAKFCNPALAGEVVSFPEVGEIELDAEGCFEIEHEELIAQLKQVSGFRFVPEVEKPVVKEDKPKKEKPAPVKEEKEEPKNEAPDSAPAAE